MAERVPKAGDLLRWAAVGFHTAALLAALVVPAYAILDAAGAFFGAGHSASLTGVLNVRRWLTLLENTGVVCGVAGLTAVGMGTCLGLLVARTDMPGRRALVGAALLGACVPVYVSAVFFLSLAPRLLSIRFPGLCGLRYDLVCAGLCGLLYGLVYAPLATLVLGTAFRAAGRELEELALLDAGRATVLLRVTLPQAAWGIVAVVMIVTLFVATDFTIADLLIVRTFSEECYTQYQLDHGRVGPLLTSVPVMLVLAVLLAVVERRYRLLGEDSPWEAGAKPPTLALRRWRIPAGVAAGALVAAGAGTLLVPLVLRLRPLAGLGAAVLNLRHELWTTTALAALGATLVVLPAGGLAWAIARGARLRWLAAAAIVLLLAIPAPTVGISLTALLNRPGVLGAVYDSPVVVAIGYFVRFLPIGVLLLIPAVRRTPCELEWAARVDGCDWLGVHRHVRWPALRRDAILAWLVVVILCFGEVGATMLVVPPGWETTAIRAFTLMHFGVYRDLAVLALLSIGCILLPWGGLAWLLARRRTCES